MNNSLPPTTLAADAVPAELTKLGHYELLDCIGRGGMGLVYRARDTRLDRQVAIKCLRTELFEAHYVERFKREALLLAKLNHPNIVQIYDFIEAPTQLALVMELVEGQNLQLHLREHIAPFTQRMRWLTEIAQGLAVAHDAGIIHRDLKAENILINQRKVAKITDLGIAKSQDYNATLTDHVAGSYCSMSPEQAMGEAIDFKSDLFSFGILAYQLLCGAHPFGDTNNKLQLMQRIISHPPTAPGKHNPNLPAEINDLLGQLLSKDPAKRPDNTHWVAAQFETLSHLQPANDFVSDDTQALIPSGAATNQSNVKNTGINSAVRTQDHPTFETRFVAVSTAPKKSRWLPIKNYLIENKISVGFGLFSVLILAAVVIWQLQPKPPKYIAVIPPKLTAEGMQKSQQELINGAVYDAIQQSVIQLDGYYLIPRNEIADLNGNLEDIRRATAADELITTEIQCKTQSCTINLSRLTPENEKPSNRLIVENTITIDTLTENYLSIAEIIHTNINATYEQKSNSFFSAIDEKDYSTFLEASINYKNSGASENILSKLENLKPSLKITSSTQGLYRAAALDLYFETKDQKILSRLAKYLDTPSPNKNNAYHLINIYYLKLAESDFFAAEKIIRDLQKYPNNSSSINELYGYAMMEKADYKNAETFFKKALITKPTTNNYFNLANTYWYMGDYKSAKNNLNNALSLSPEDHKTNSLQGIISMLEGKTDEAITSFEKAIAKNPNDIANLNNLGLCHMISKNYDAAYIAFKKAKDKNPLNTTILLNMADSKNLAGTIDESTKLYQLIIDTLSNQKQSKEELRNIAQAYAHLGLISEALKSLQLLERNDPQNVETMYTSALVHALAQNKASSILSIENALASGMHNIWFNLSWFDSLCTEATFVKTTINSGAPNRCPP